MLIRGTVSMKPHSLVYVFVALLMVLLQVWVFNYTYLFRVATPFVYLFDLMLLPIGFSKVGSTLLGAVLGMIIDVFSGTPGLHMASTALTGFLRPYFLRFLMKPDIDTTLPPASKVMGKGVFLILFIWVFIHHSLLFFLDAFSGFNWWVLIVRLGASSIFTYVCLVILQLLFFERNSQRT